MRQSSKHRRATVVLPAAMGGALQDEQIVRWLSRGALCKLARSIDSLHQVLGLLDLESPVSGLAALRFWGQTGERSTTWMAAADPVHLEPLINDLRVQAFKAGEVTATELRSLYADLQKSLAGDSGLVFASIGMCGYLRGLEALPAADASPGEANGEPAECYLPRQDPDGVYHRLLGEIQLALHEHDINRERRAAGQREINSLWIWGAGVAPEKEVIPVPPLFTNDPLFRGYWESCTGVIDDWQGDFNHCLDIAVGDFVVVTDDESINIDQLRQLRQLLTSGQVGELALFFRDGLHARLGRLSGLRFWRSRSELFDAEQWRG